MFIQKLNENHTLEDTKRWYWK